MLARHARRLASCGDRQLLVEESRRSPPALREAADRPPPGTRRGPGRARRTPRRRRRRRACGSGAATRASHRPSRSAASSPSKPARAVLHAAASAAERRQSRPPGRSPRACRGRGRRSSREAKEEELSGAGEGYLNTASSAASRVTSTGTRARSAPSIRASCAVASSSRPCGCGASPERASDELRLTLRRTGSKAEHRTRSRRSSLCSGSRRTASIVRLRKRCFSAGVLHLVASTAIPSSRRSDPLAVRQPLQVRPPGGSRAASAASYGSSCRRRAGHERQLAAVTPARGALLLARLGRWLRLQVGPPAEIALSRRSWACLPPHVGAEVGSDSASHWPYRARAISI